MVENEMNSKIKCLISENGGEFTSKELIDFCSKHGIKRQFFIARTPQHNGVFERKNMIVQEMARTMLLDSKLTYCFWTHAVNTIVHIQNQVMLRNNSDKNPYELWKGILENVKHFMFLELNATSKKKIIEWESLILLWTKEYLFFTQI
jgi:transposase InsO family protein